MSGATAFDYESARRIARTVHAVERMQGDRSGPASPSVIDTRGPMVKTPATLPGGYDGSAPLTGTLVERLPDDTILEIATVYIKNADAIPLEADKIYLARIAGHATVSGTTRPLFLVDAVDLAAPSGLSMGHYTAGSVTLSGGIYYTTVTLYAGGTLTLTGAPWGKDAVATRQWLNHPALNHSNWTVLLRDTVANTSNYQPIPFSIPADVRRFGTAFYGYGQIVECRSAPGAPWVCKAWDPLSLVPVSGIYRALLVHRPASDPGVGPMGFVVDAVNMAAPVAGSSGVSLSGQAFPAGMGGAFPGPGSFGTNTEPVE